MVLCLPAHAGGAGHPGCDRGCADLEYTSPEACDCMGPACVLAGLGRWPASPLDECNQGSLQKALYQGQTERLWMAQGCAVRGTCCRAAGLDPRCIAVAPSETLRTASCPTGTAGQGGAVAALLLDR